MAFAICYILSFLIRSIIAWRPLASAKPVPKGLLFFPSYGVRVTWLGLARWAFGGDPRLALHQHAWANDEFPLCIYPLTQLSFDHDL
jgi:hypothetical protein